MPTDLIIEQLLVFCDQHSLFDKLLSEIQQRNRRVYEKYKDHLYETAGTGLEKSVFRIPASCTHNWFKTKVVIAVSSIVIVISTIIWFIWLNSPQPEPFEVDEFGIVIADFGKGTNAVKYERGIVIAELLRRDLCIKIQKVGLTKVEVVKLGRVIRNEDEAKERGTHLRASMIVWGWEYSDEDIFFLNFTPTRTLSQAIEDGELRLNYATLQEVELLALGKGLADRTIIYATFAIGLVHMSGRDYKAAVREFGKAIELNEGKLGTCDVTAHRLRPE
jgi:hypothetical protein